MKIRILIATLLFAASTLVVSAQQLPQFTQFVQNKFVLNPAYAGMDGGFEATTLYRSQWTGITDAPRTYTLALSAPSKDLKMAFGGHVYTDVVGPTRRFGVRGAYAYSVKLNAGTDLSFGLSAGIVQHTIDGSQITLRQADDPALANVRQAEILPDGAFGIGINGAKYFAGISIENLLNNRLKYFNTSGDSRLVRHYALTGAYTFNLSTDFELVPSAQMRYVPSAPLETDIGLRGVYREMVWLGANYRTGDALGILGGVVIQDYLQIGYAYDMTMSAVRSFTGATHEVFIGIRFSRLDNKLPPPEPDN